MTKVEKVKKLMERYNVSLDDLRDVDDEETVKVEEPKKDETVEDKKPEEPLKEVETKPEEVKGEVETPKEDVSLKEDYDIKSLLEAFKQQSEEIKVLKETLSAQSVKTDKAYEMLSALGEEVSKEPEELGLEYQNKFGGNYKPNFEGATSEQNEFAKRLNDGYSVK